MEKRNEPHDMTYLILFLLFEISQWKSYYITMHKEFREDKIQHF